MTMPFSRRSLLSALGITIPFGLGHHLKAAETVTELPPLLRFRKFEEVVHAAFANPSLNPVTFSDDQASACRRVEVGHSDLVSAGVQGSHNARPFAGFPAGSLRIVRTGSEPGPTRQGVRLCISTVDLVVVKDRKPGIASRPLDFASLPPVPVLDSSDRA